MTLYKTKNMLKSKYIINTIGCIILFMCSSNLSSQVLTNPPYIWYTFDGSLVDSEGHSTLTLIPDPPGDGSSRENTTRAFGSNTFGKYWRWTSTQARGGGFTILADKDLGEEYTIYLRFSFDDVGETSGSWKKIIDYKNKSSDTGFYFHSYGKVQFYPEGHGSKQTKNGELIVLVCTRDEAGTFRVYIANESDYTLTLDYTANSGVNSIFDTSLGSSLMGFFFDDNATGAEATNGGQVYEIRVWDKLLIKEEIDDIINKGEIIVRHLDRAGNDISSPERLTGNDGVSYITEAKRFNNCILVESPTNKSGFFEKGKSFEVKYVYDCYAFINPDLRNMPQ